MKKNKGFTLIELLTVIAILAVILLIAAPTILGVLDKAKKNTFKNQVLLYVEGLKQEVVLNEIGQSNINITWNSNIAYIDFTDIPMESSNYKGKIKIERNNEKYTYTIIDAHGDGYKLDSQINPNEITNDNVVADDKKEVKEYTITNMVINGSFENGIKNWESTFKENDWDGFDYYSIGTVSDEQSYIGKYSYKIVPYTAEVPYAYVYFKGDNSAVYNLNFYNNHIYYSTVNYLSPNSKVELTVHSEDWNSDVGILYYEIKDASPIWSKSSIYFAVPRDKVAFIRVVNKNENLDATSYFDGLILVDLTETFGPGNEPSKEWCDKNISYFDGTVKIYK